MKAERLRPDLLALAALGLAWLGVWGAWIPHATAGLTQNAPRLAYWSSVLPEVRSGALALMPEMLRLSVALASLALAVAAGAVSNRWLRWALRLVALLPGLVLLPPYPYVLDLWGSAEYGRRFLIASLVWVGVPTSGLLDLWSAQLRRAATIVLAAAAGGLGVWTFATLRVPFAARYAESIPPGWGVVAFVGGLGLAAVLLVISTLRRDRTAAAPGQQRTPT